MLHNRKTRIDLRGSIKPRVFGSRQRANRNRTLIAFQILFLSLAMIVINGTQVHAEDIAADKLPAGRWRGTFLFYLDHTWDASQQNLVNYYSMQSEVVAGTIIFVVDKTGHVTYSRIIIPQFPFTVVASLIDDRFEDNPCKGYNVYAGGMATAKLSTITSTAPSLGPSRIIDTPAVQITTGSTWGQISVIGDCGGMPPSSTLNTSIQDDFNLLSASSWRFTDTGGATKVLSGTCTTNSWTTENRSVNCTWAAWPSGK